MTAKDSSILSLVDEAATFDVSDEFKVYLEQQRELARLSLEVDGIVGEVIAKNRTAYSQWDQLSKSERATLGADVDDLLSQWNVLASEMAETQAASDQYYAEEGIGEASDGSYGFIDYVLRGGWLVVLVAGFGIRWWRRSRQGLVECATCGLEVPAKTGKCPNCGGRLRVPRPPPADDAGASASAAAVLPPAEAPAAPAVAEAEPPAEPEDVEDAAEELAVESEATAEAPDFGESEAPAWEPAVEEPTYETPDFEEVEAEEWGTALEEPRYEDPVEAAEEPAETAVEGAETHEA